ncbi:MAG: hypothetical protein LKK13_00085 [Bacilli bacterium]|nr:hypothetical protein [Bacilli bacterium]
MNGRYRLKMAAEIALVALTIGSLSIGTYAWFSMQNRATATLWSMHVVKGLSNKLKYYRGNYDPASVSYTGYPDIRMSGVGPSNASTVSSYASDFITVPGGKFSPGGPLDISHLTPGYCQTFSFEVGNDSEVDIPVEMDLTSFLSPESPTNRIYDGGNTDCPITLGSAIDIYAKGYELSDDDVANTAFANSFIKDYMEAAPEDRFTYHDIRDGTDRKYVLYDGAIPGKKTYIVFLTLEFTDLGNTFYAYEGTDGTYVYYVRSPSGSSDCYQGLTFALQDIYIKNPE